MQLNDWRMGTKFAEYLGDGVYVGYREDGVIILTTGTVGSNIIYLEPEVVVNLVNYLSALPEKIKEQTSKT
jgi:hypothetical protein